MLNEKLSNEQKRFQMITWRAKQHGAQVVEGDLMRQFTATVAEQKALLANVHQQRTISVS